MFSDVIAGRRLEYQRIRPSQHASVPRRHGLQERHDCSRDQEFDAHIQAMNIPSEMIQVTGKP
jgi:hypothetical protein